MQPIIFPIQSSNSFGGLPAPFVPALRTGFVDPVPLLPPLLHPILFATTGQSHGIRDRGVPALLMGKLPLPAVKLLISGVTKDSAGAILGSCIVALYLTENDQMMERVTSDGTTGVYSFSAVGPSETYYVVAYKAGFPDVSGTTANTLVGT